VEVCLVLAETLNKEKPTSTINVSATVQTNQRNSDFKSNLLTPRLPFFELDDLFASHSHSSRKFRFARHCKDAHGRNRRGRKFSPAKNPIGLILPIQA
jgi:hypothetical protein